ncbi:MAG TPA: hypothetical protein VNT26_24010 [Candidatus Sulfotelmatobacter sp.]|nr:hypothetical protein [Candidatus Sulfotelmatobacter sp.]
MNPPITDSAPHPSPVASRRTWGFRFSLTDAVALVAFGAVAAGLYRLESSFSWLVVIAAGHFFLFCNVFRLVRRRELIWTALYLLNVGFWLLLGRLDWFSVLACQLPVSVGVISWEMKATRYHGVGADRLNPALNDYLEGRIH